MLMPDLDHLSLRHEQCMALWRETRRKYWLNEARRYWLAIERVAGAA